MRYGFVTCVQLGLECMAAVYDAGATLELAVTLLDDQARSKSGRVYLDEFCKQHGVQLLKVHNVNDQEVVAAIRLAQIDWLFIIGWSQIARSTVLAVPQLGVLGMHPTLLPNGRGRAAVPWAILKRLPETGVTLFKLNEGVDTGDIVAQERISLGERETATSLYEKVEEAHRRLMMHAIPQLEKGQLHLTPQDESQATEWAARRPEDGRIDPTTMTVADVDCLVRAVTHPYPGAFLDCLGFRLRVWAGRPAYDMGQCSPGEYVLRAADGYYVCTEYEFE